MQTRGRWARTFNPVTALFEQPQVQVSSSVRRLFPSPIPCQHWVSLPSPAPTSEPLHFHSHKLGTCAILYGGYCFVLGETDQNPSSLPVPWGPDVQALDLRESLASGSRARDLLLLGR